MKISIEGHTRDSFSITVEHGACYIGYPPPFLSQDADGIQLDIDVATGKIIGWNAEQAKKWISENMSLD